MFALFCQLCFKICSFALHNCIYIYCDSVGLSYMPYLTLLWDEISQNLAQLEANSHKNFQISENFQTILKHISWRTQHTSHFFVFITSFIHSNKGFWRFWGSFKVIFVKIAQNVSKSPLRICLISQISVHSLWHVWSLLSRVGCCLVYLLTRKYCQFSLY